MLQFIRCAIVLVAVTALQPVAANAQELLASYTARLSSKDHFNSSGARLRSAAAIIRQDRANFHRYGRRDPQDQWDSFFASKANCARMERMLNRGTSTRAVRSRIVNGTPIIRVEIYGRGNRGSHIEVWVQ